MFVRITQISLILLIIAAIPVIAQPTKPQNKEASQLFNDGNKLLKSGDFSGAIDKYKAAIAIEKHEHFFYQLGLAYRKSRNEDKAIESFTKSVTQNPKFAYGYNGIAGGYFAKKDYTRAIENYEKALAENPTLGVAKKGLAAAQAAEAAKFVNRGETNKAIALTRKAVKNNPKLSQAYVIMAQAFNKDGKYSDAIKAANNAIKNGKGKRQGAAYFEKGLAYRNLGNPAKAKAAFLEAKKDPTYARNAAYELKQL